MPISLQKLENFLKSNGLIPKKFFLYKTHCIYIEILCISNAEIFLLYIPSKYKLDILNHENTYKINYLEIDEEGNIPFDYAGEPDDFEMEKNYDDVDINSNNYKNGEIQQFLEENYNKTVSLKDINRQDTKNLRDVFRQLKRLKFCVQSIKYKLALVYKNFLCCIKRNDDLECLIVQNYSYKDKRKLIVTLDLESLYSNILTVSFDIKTVKEAIYKVFNKNQRKNIKNLTNILEHRDKLSIYSDTIYQQKEEQTNYINELEELLEKVQIIESKILEKLVNIDKKYSDPGLVGMHSDIQKSHIISKHETELEKINNTKQNIIKEILEIKSIQENLMLTVDKITFDNTVMIDCINNNFNKLSEFT